MIVQETPDASDVKGKGKAKGPRILGEDAVQTLSKAEMESELKELEGLKEDLALKVEELKTTPNEPVLSAPEMVAKALDKELNASAATSSGSGSKPAAPAQVNDLTGMVKKKKKAAPETVEANGAAAPSVSGSGSTTGKRKAEDEESASPSEKKVKLDDEVVS